MPRTRVVHIITRLILGGAQENTLLTVEGLHRMPQYDVTLVTGPAIGPEGELVSRARASGARLVLVDAMRREIHPWRDLVSFVKLFVILRRLRPHIVHTHSSKAGVLGRFAARLAGVPVVIHSIHGLPFHPYQSRVANWFYRMCERVSARLADVIVTVADAMAEKAAAAGVWDRRKFRTIYSGFELAPYAAAAESRSAARAELGIPADAPVVGKIARIFELKGHEFIVQAAPGIVARVPNVRVLFVGDGTARPEIERRIAALGLQDHFILTGMVPRDRVPYYLGAMDVVVHTSLREGLARALPQGMVAGLPVVSYDIDGASEVITDGETGYLLPPRDIDTLADRLVTLLRDPLLRRSMGERGREVASRLFSVEHMVAELDELYQEFRRHPHPPMLGSSHKSSLRDSDRMTG